MQLCVKANMCVYMVARYGEDKRGAQRLAARHAGAAPRQASEYSIGQPFSPHKSPFSVFRAASVIQAFMLHCWMFLTILE